MFAIPAVKGVEFGSGFAGARLRGSQNNDPLLDVEGTTATNNAGGINGGITNGNEIVVRAAVKPTPSIGREQNTYNLATDKVEPLTIRGRHDVCVALRGAVVAEAAVAIALANLIRHCCLSPKPQPHTPRSRRAPRRSPPAAGSSTGSQPVSRDFTTPARRGASPWSPSPNWRGFPYRPC